MSPDTLSSEGSVASPPGIHKNHPRVRATFDINTAEPRCPGLLERRVTDERPGSAAAAATAVLGCHLENSLSWTPKPPDWIRQAIGLLETAARQVDLKGAAHATLVHAASLLRKCIVPQTHDTAHDRKGQLLAWQARQVLTYIDSHITDRVLVADLSALVRCSAAHFSRLFRRTFGESPYAFIVRRRVELAARQMLDTAVPLSDIALSCGFTDQAHMTKCFRNVMQDTPSAWRRAHGTE